MRETSSCISLCIIFEKCVTGNVAWETEIAIGIGHAATACSVHAHRALW